MTDVAPAVLVQPYTRLVLENNENVGHGEKGALGDVAEVVLDAEDVSCLGCKCRGHNRHRCALWLHHG